MHDDASRRLAVADAAALDRAANHLLRKLLTAGYWTPAELDGVAGPVRREAAFLRDQVVGYDRRRTREVEVHVHFTQCNPDFEVSEDLEQAARLPIEPRLAQYRELLDAAVAHGYRLFCTHDEHVVLLAVQYRRHGQIDRLGLHSHCRCGAQSRYVESFEVDRHGEWGGHVAHNFFNQRMGLLH